ncbi:MAG TPA: hypothetical protein VF026_20665 [Ktedonobacteraceae bacterium]
MRHHLSTNYHIIRVMFWSFPYLLWQAFGHWSGFLVGVLVAVMLTAMLDDLFCVDNWNTASSVRRQSLQTAESQPHRQEAETYQCGYWEEAELYRANPYPYQVGELQPQYEEMQVLYPQEEMPPMEH